MNRSVRLLPISLDGGEKGQEEDMGQQRNDERESQTFHSGSDLVKKPTLFTSNADESSFSRLKFLTDGIMERGWFFLS